MKDLEGKKLNFQHFLIINKKCKKGRLIKKHKKINNMTKFKQQTNIFAQPTKQLDRRAT